MKLKELLRTLFEYFDDTEDPVDEPVYDPVHIAGMFVITLFGISILFWLLWSLLVFGGGLQAKVVPFIQVVFTSKTWADFGYVGYPYEMGVFEGWITNVIALLFSMGVIAVIWYLYTIITKTGEQHRYEDPVQ